MDVIWIAVLALAGGLAIALLGWTESQEAFEVRKFSSSVIRSVIAAVAIAAAFSYSGTVSGIDLLIAFLAGAGADVSGNRIAGAIAARTSSSK